MKSTVSIRKCEDYEPRLLSAAVENALSDMGGIHNFVRPGDKVLLKPNLLKQRVLLRPWSLIRLWSRRLPPGCWTPEESVCWRRTASGQSQTVLSKSGYDPMMKKLGIFPAPFLDRLPVDFPEGRLFRRIDLAREVFEYDAVINLAKLKTHAQMVFTLAVKNLFGTVIGTDKASWHLRAGKDIDTFATVLVQIYEKIKPAIFLCGRHSRYGRVRPDQRRSPPRGHNRRVNRRCGTGRCYLSAHGLRCKDSENLRDCARTRRRNSRT